MAQVEINDSGRKASNGALDLVFNTAPGQYIGKRINPNRITEVGGAASFALEQAIANGDFLQSVWELALVGACEILDGGAAKRFGKQTKYGAALDSVTDRVVDLRILNGMSRYAQSQGWKETEALAETAKLLSVNVSLNRAVVVRDGRDADENGIGSRRYRFGIMSGCIIASALKPQYSRIVWDVGLATMNGLSLHTGLDRLKLALPPEVFKDVSVLFNDTDVKRRTIDVLKTIGSGYVKEAAVSLLGMDRFVRGLPSTQVYSQTRTEGILYPPQQAEGGALKRLPGDTQSFIGVMGLAALRKFTGVGGKLPEATLVFTTARSLIRDLQLISAHEQQEKEMKMADVSSLPRSLSKTA